MTAAAWFAGGGTVAAVFVAILQIGIEQRRRAHVRRYEQAEQVSAWYGGSVGERDLVRVSNTSPEPVYMAVISLVIVAGAGFRTGEEMTEPAITDLSDAQGMRAVVKVVPPGSSWTTLYAGWGGMGRQPGMEIAFTDLRGEHWVRRATGKLDSISEPPIQHMKIPLPCSFLDLKPGEGPNTPR